MFVGVVGAAAAAAAVEATTRAQPKNERKPN